MDTSQASGYLRNDGGGISFLSVPDLESLEEITDGDAQELLKRMSTTARCGSASTSTGSGSGEADASVSLASRSLKGNATDLPQLYPSQSMTSSSGNNGSTSIGTALPLRCSSARRDSLRSSITAEFSGTLPPPVATVLSQPRQTRSAAATATAGVRISIPSYSTSAAPPSLKQVSDTAVLDTERRRWSSQLVQECWMHQELHSVRWNEQRLLKRGAAYRPRAIAARTAVKMTHTKSLCIALNVDTSIIESSGGVQVANGAEDDLPEVSRIPVLSSSEAEAWPPLLMWRSLALISGDASTVLSQLSDCLSEQYEGLAPRPLPTSCCANARPSDLVQTLSDARKDAGEAKVIFHYLARGVPPPRGGNLYFTNTASGAGGYAGPPYSKLSLDTFRSRVGTPLVFIADCAEAREILNYYIRMCEEQHQQRYFTSSREYQLKSSRQVSMAELDGIVDGQMGVAGGGFERAGSGADFSAGDSHRCGRGVGEMDGMPPAQCALLQKFYFIGASGSSTMGSGSGAGGSSLRDKSINCGGGGGYDDFNRSFGNPVRGGFAGSGRGGPGGTGAGGGNAGALRYHVRLPSDILTSCLTTPLRMAVLWFIAERPELQELHPLLLRLFPGALKDKRTPLGQLQWYLQSIIECIAWSTLSLPEYSRLFREDVYVAPLFRGYILAERIIVGGLDGCLSVYPPLAPTHSHTLWSTWDNLVERACVSVLRAVHPAPPRCASVLEFRSWLDERVTSWKYARQHRLSLPTSHAGAASVFGDGGRHSCLPSTPDETAVLMPSLFTESLLGLQAQLDGITQQSFERPRVFAEIVGLQLPAPLSSVVWEAGRGAGGAEGGSGDEREGGPRPRRQTPASGRNMRSDTTGQKRPGMLLLLRDVADEYSNSLRSSYTAQQQLNGGAFTPEGTRNAGGVSPTVSVASVGELRGGSSCGAVKGDGTRHTSPRGARGGPAEGGKAAKDRGMPGGGRPRTSQKNSAVPSDSASSAALGGSGGGGGGGATAVAQPPNPAAAAVARMETWRSPSRLSDRKAEYVTNIYANYTAAGQAGSFQCTAGRSLPKGGSDLYLASTASTSALAAAAQPHQHHTFPFMDRMPLLLQALLVAAHREKATELICRLVDCGAAAVLQCAEANIYRFVLDRYWSRPDLRFLMPATLFIYCKSCYADPELIGDARQRDVAVRACAEILQSPVEVPPLTSTSGVTAEEAPGAWQNATLGPYATRFGQRMLAAALLTLIALHSDDGREACHRYGVFQLCCQLLHHTREDPPLLLMSCLEMAASGAAAAGTSNTAPSMPPLPRPPSSILGSNACFFSPLQAQSRAAAAATPATAAASSVEEPPLPSCIATTYHVTLLTLFVSLLCNWKPAATAPPDSTEAEGAGEDENAKATELRPPLDGRVHELPPTTPHVLAAGLEMVSPALFKFTYSDTSILRGAALRCFMMVLISPAPSLQSRNGYVEEVLRFIQSETLHRCEVNTDLRLEGLGMAYTTFRWLLDQLCEDLPIEDIGQYVAVWIYKWFRLNALGKTISSPFTMAGPSGGTNSRGATQDGSPLVHQRCQQQQQQQSSVFYQSSTRNQWVPSTPMPYRGSSAVTPGSVYVHRGSSTLVPAARSAYGGGTLEASGGGMTGGLVNAMGGGLRQHLVQQDHRRLQSCLSCLSNIARLFFEHTQDACPYIRTYARKVVTEEFSFLRRAWYDDYVVHDLHTPQRDEDYAGGVGGHHHSHHLSQRHRGYSARASTMRETHASVDAVHGAGGDCGLGGLTSADPLASSMDGGGDLTTYLPLREMLSSGEVFNDSLSGRGGGGNSSRGSRPHHRDTSPVVPPAAAAVAANMMADTHAGAAPASAPARMMTEMEDLPDPQPAVLRRFIGRLLRIAAANGSRVARSFSSFPRNTSRHHLDGSGRDGGMMAKDSDGGVAADDVGERNSGRYWGNRRDNYPRSGSDQGDEGNYTDESKSRRRHGSRGANTAHRRGMSGDRGQRDEEDSYSSFDDAVDEDADRDLDGTLLDSDGLALHPLWAMDSTSMKNFAYGALGFLERFMLEKMDDGDPRHPMNLEKENALHHYYQRVERNIRAFAQDELPSTEATAADTGAGGGGASAVLVPSEGEMNDATAGGFRALSSAAATAPAPFHRLGVGEIGLAGIPGYSERRSGLRSRDRTSTFALHSRRRNDRPAEAAEGGGGSRVSGNVDVVLFHPSEPLVITSTTGGLLSVWSYDHLGLPTTGNDEEVERVHAGCDENDINKDEGDDAEEEGSEAARTPWLRQRSAFRSEASTAPPRRLHARAQFFLRDVVSRSRSDLNHVARPRFMYDRFNPNGEVLGTREEAGRRRPPPRSNTGGRRSARERESLRCPNNFYRRDEMGGGGGGSRAGTWMDRAEAANAIAALPSSYQHGHPHYYHGVGDLHLVDAAHRPLICAVRRFGAVEVFSHFTDRHRVSRVVTFETARFGQNEGADQCVSSYQTCTGLLYVSNGEGGVSAWDLGNEQRLATLGTLSGADSLSAVGSGSVSALKANPYVPYEYLVGSYGKQVCLFDLRDGSSGVARFGYANPSSQFNYMGSSPASCYDTGGTGLLSSLCVRVCYSRRYPDAVVAGYACGTVAVWDRRYPKQPSLIFGAALNGVMAEGGGGDGLGRAGTLGLGANAAPMEGRALSMIRQLDVHPCSKRFLTLTTTPTTLQLMQPCRNSGCGTRDTPGRTEARKESNGGSDRAAPQQQRRLPPACIVQNYDLATDSAGDGAGDVSGVGGNCEPGAACFHDFSPVLCVGIGSSVLLYGTSHLSTMATYMDVDVA
ncbi:hypothetical protein ABL78_2736 [Leptomonas seymouri]|uniref:Raptor N-terminal CASPase-like domain-containing protein n=1 Tax=Leptomonas seymouri TaxID=5684 RepID=A0A0N0P6Y7_LEPSE|nr:hypothetical protein ABL78_2736 [Leptomonas seymouri]|eukprot:KPI88159.1 hypothetical protein ABL78_2736 [Leptomonas seymouri]